jgi:hypothetical protein
MKRAILFVLLIAPLTVCAQESAFDYDNTVTGTSTTLESGQPLTEQLTSTPFTGSLDGTLTLTGTAGAPGSLLDFTFTVSGLPAPDSFSGSLVPFGGSGDEYCSPIAGCVTLDVLNGAVTGATANLNDEVYNGPSDTVSITPTGVVFDSILAPPPAGGTGCSAPTQVSYGPSGGTYVGPTVNDCTVTAAGVGPGTWSDPPANSAPEISAASAPSAITLLIGALLVLCGRKSSCAG